MKRKFLYVCLPILLVGLVVGGFFLFLEHQENQRIAREAELTARELFQVEDLYSLFIASYNRDGKVALLGDTVGFRIESADGYAYVRYAIDATVSLMQNWFYYDYIRQLELHKAYILGTEFKLYELPVLINDLHDLILLISQENISGIRTDSIIVTALYEVDFLEYVQQRTEKLYNTYYAFFSTASRESKLLNFNGFNAYKSECERIGDIVAFTVAFKESRDSMYNWFVDDYTTTYTQLRERANMVETQGQATEFISELRELLAKINHEAVLTYSDNNTFADNANSLFADVANAIDRQPSLVSWMRENTGIRIDGDDRFVRRVESAMDIIRRHPDFYELVNTYIDIIRPGVSPDRNVGGGYMDVFYAGGPTFVIDAITMAESLMWIAGSIVHDAYHSKLFFEYDSLWPDPDIWADGLGHMKTYEVQIDFLREAGASSHYIQWIRQWMTDYYRRMCEYRRGLREHPEGNCCRFGVHNWTWIWRSLPVLHHDPMPDRFRIAPDETPHRILRLWQ